MTFEEILDQAMVMLQRRGRLTIGLSSGSFSSTTRRSKTSRMSSSTVNAWQPMRTAAS